MKPRRRNVASAVSTKLKASATTFVKRCDVPATQAMTAPISGTRMRTLRMYVISSTQTCPPALEEAQAKHERDDHDDPEDDDPGVALHLAGLPLAQPQTRSHGLQADRVHGSVDDRAVEPVGPRRDYDPCAADTVHDAVDDHSVEPVKGPGRAVHDGPSERVVRVVDPVPFREHAVDEGTAPGCGEAFRRHALRRVHSPGEGEAQDCDAHRDPLEQVVLHRDAHEREAGF